MVQKNGNHVIVMTPENDRRKSIVYWAASSRQNVIFRNSENRAHIGRKWSKNGNHVFVMTPENDRRKSIVYWVSSSRQNVIFRNSENWAHIGWKWSKSGDLEQKGEII